MSDPKPVGADGLREAADGYAYRYPDGIRFGYPRNINVYTPKAEDAIPFYYLETVSRIVSQHVAQAVADALERAANIAHSHVESHQESDSIGFLKMSWCAQAIERRIRSLIPPATGSGV